VFEVTANEGDIIRIGPTHRGGREKKDGRGCHMWHEHHYSARVRSSEFRRREVRRSLDSNED
jgi:hypothetical protein